MKKLRSLFEIAAVLVVGLFCTGELLAQRISIPPGTLVDLRMDTGLNSGRARVNDAFQATVTRAVWIDGRIAVPRDSKVDGRVSMVQPATHGSRSGIIAVSFTQITIDGRRYAIIYASSNLVRGAQTELQHLRYYQGPVNGVLDTGTRRAIAHFQIDNNQHGTGDLDQETAVELGLVRYEEPGGPGSCNGGYGH